MSYKQLQGHEREVIARELAARLKSSGLVLSISESAEATRALIAADAPRWREMVQLSGAKIE